MSADSDSLSRTAAILVARSKDIRAGEASNDAVLISIAIVYLAETISAALRQCSNIPSLTHKPTKDTNHDQ